jgi:hypothetical protein
VDWYEAAVDFDDGRQTAHFFTMRSMAGGGAFHTAYSRPSVSSWNGTQITKKDEQFSFHVIPYLAGCVRASALVTWEV